MNALLLIAMQPKSSADAERLAAGLDSLMREDPTITVRAGASQDTVVIGAMGETHLDVIVTRLHTEFGVEANLGRPQVGYVETITVPAAGEMKHAQPFATAGVGYAHVKLRLEQAPAGSGCTFENAISGGTIPEQFMAAVEEGTRDALATGSLAGYPIVDVRVVIYDGSYHDVDSTPAAFKLAAAGALHDAAKKGKPMLLEPVMRVDVAWPLQFGPEPLTSLVRRGGKVVESAAPEDNEYRAALYVPLAEMFGYNMELQERTNGRGMLRTALAYYQPCGPTGSSDDDRISPVGAPLKPLTPSRRSSIALPEE